MPSLTDTAESHPDAAVFPKRTGLNRLTETLEQWLSFLSVPLNRYKKITSANHCFAHTEINAVISAVIDAADDGELSVDDAVNLLGSLVSRLAGLKQELEDRSSKEDLQAQRFKDRAIHVSAATIANFSYFKSVGFDRILVDYMLRMSYLETATKIADIYCRHEFHDTEELDKARAVISALREKEVSPALAWCADNKSELMKSESKLELNLRLQEFVELVRNENDKEAITYAQKYIAPWGETHMEEVQRVLATLAFCSNTQCARYKVFYEAKQWDKLVDQFKQEFYKFYGMTYEPLLHIYLQAGLCALKNPFCNKENDPLSQEDFKKLASPFPMPLPMPVHNYAIFVCHITGELMGPGNEPGILPNGYIYSANAIREMNYRNYGIITCPRTGAVCRSSQMLLINMNPLNNCGLTTCTFWIAIWI